jgi:hypothetical protein
MWGISLLLSFFSSPTFGFTAWSGCCDFIFLRDDQDRCCVTSFRRNNSTSNDHWTTTDLWRWLNSIPIWHCEEVVDTSAVYSKGAVPAQMSAGSFSFNKSLGNSNSLLLLPLQFETSVLQSVR